MRRWFVALALLALLGPASYAGELYTRVEGPGRDGVTYTARTFSCDNNITLRPWAIAEGVVDGKHQSVLIRLNPTKEYGVYRFTRTWPQQGTWMIRYALAHPTGAATVVSLGANGAVQDNQFYYKSDGHKECYEVLKTMIVKPSIATANNKDDC